MNLSDVECSTVDVLLPPRPFLGFHAHPRFKLKAGSSPVEEPLHSSNDW